MENKEFLEEAKKDLFLLNSENIDNNVITNTKNYTVYHLHSYYSLLDSCTSPKDYILNFNNQKCVVTTTTYINFFI